MRLIALALLTALSGSTAWAQAWVPAAGEAYVRVAQGFASAEERFDAEGMVVPYNETTGETVRDRSVYLYGEVGLGRGAALVALLPYRRVTVTDPQFTPPFDRESAAWGTAALGLRYDLGRVVGLARGGPTVLAANATVGLPLGYTRNYRPAVGPGQVDLTLSLDLGRSLWPFPGYVQGRLGYRHRTGLYGLSTATACDRNTDADGDACFPDADARRDYGDEFIVGAEAGATLGPVLVQALLDGAWSVTRPTSEPVGAPPESFVRQRLLRAGVGLTVYGPYGLGVGAQVFVPAHAQNALRTAEWFVGFEKRF